MLEVSNLIKDFDKKRALDSLNFSVREGSSFGLLGRNGAGKSTCIKIIMDIFPADSGSVTIDGLPNNKCGKKIGYLPEERGLYPKRTIIEQMIYFGQLRGLTAQEAKKNALRLLEELEASEYTGRRLDTLSKGNQQKIQLAIALINDPEIIILDEPFSGLDPVNAHILKNMITEQSAKGRTIIFSSHQMSVVEGFCDDICIIHNGSSVLSGNLREIKRSYPRNSVYIEAVSGNEKLAGVLKGAGYTGITEKGAGITVGIKDSEQDKLLNCITANNIAIDTFSVIQPSLEDIFIEKAGGYDNETV